MKLEIDFSKITTELKAMLQAIVSEELQKQFIRLQEIMPEKIDRVLTIKEAAKYALVCTKTIHEWKKQGLPCSHARIFQSELIKFIKNNPSILKKFRKRHKINLPAYHFENIF